VASAHFNALRELGCQARAAAVEWTRSTIRDLQLLSGDLWTCDHFIARIQLKLAAVSGRSSGLLEKRINVALGTDGAASNTTWTLLVNARLPLLGQRCSGNRRVMRTALLAWRRWPCARRWVQPRQTGSLEPANLLDHGRKWTSLPCLANPSTIPVSQCCTPAMPRCIRTSGWQASRKSGSARTATWPDQDGLLGSGK